MLVLETLKGAVAKWSNAAVCKTVIRGFKSHPCLTMKDKLYFVGLKAFIVNEKQELLILQGSSKMKPEGLWGLPGGRIMESEEQVPLTTILAREINEECGSIIVDIGQVCAHWRLHREDKAIFLVGYTCTYKGGVVELSHEHATYKWVTSDQVSNLPFVDGYKEVIISFFKNRKDVLE